MERLGKKIIFLFAGFVACFIFAVVFFLGRTFALGFFQEDGAVTVPSNQEEFMHTLRMQAITILIENKFDHFETMPFGPGNDALHISGSTSYPQYPNYVVNKEIEVKDDLDILLEKKILAIDANYSLSYELPTFSLDTMRLDREELQHLGKVFLFKNQKDLQDLGYVVSSYRTRINTDSKESGRRDNISISYWNIGNVRVLNPGQELSFMDEIHYDPELNNGKRDTVSGLANIGGIRNVKGGGICGAAWGINAVIRPNKAFEITERFNHSRTYKNLYKNVINGKESWIPGLDIAVYSFPGSVKDFKFKNIRGYPVVLVMNYDGTAEGTEELFVLSKEEDRGELKYTGREGNCFFWEANGLPFKSCYGAILR